MNSLCHEIVLARVMGFFRTDTVPEHCLPALYVRRYMLPIGIAAIAVDEGLEPRPIAPYVNEKGTIVADLAAAILHPDDFDPDEYQEEITFYTANWLCLSKLEFTPDLTSSDKDIELLVESEHQKRLWKLELRQVPRWPDYGRLTLKRDQALQLVSPRKPRKR